MNEPQRYARENDFDGGGDMASAANGEYVTFADYAALRARFDALLRAMKEVQGEMWTGEINPMVVDRAIKNAEKEG